MLEKEVEVGVASNSEVIKLYICNFIVRLVGGSSYNDGRVEVYYNGIWGTVCNDGLNDKYASLVCTQLGFGSSGNLAYFGPGTGNIHLDSVICSMNDTVLASCGHYGVGITIGCDHSKDSGVTCIGNGYVDYLIYLYTYVCRCNNSDANYLTNSKSTIYNFINVIANFVLLLHYILLSVFFFHRTSTDTILVPTTTPFIIEGMYNITNI